MRTARYRMMVAIAALVLLLAGCGGDDGDDTGGADVTDSQDSADGPGDDEGSAGDPNDTDDGDDSSGTAGVAVVSIGDTSYEIPVGEGERGIGRCDPDFFGAFWALTEPTDDGPTIYALIADPDDENHESGISINDGDAHEWLAGHSETGQDAGSIDSFSADGDSVTGTASFVDQLGDGTTTTSGEFTITC